VKRRNFITTLLAALAGLPFLGWLKSKVDPYTLRADYIIRPSDEFVDNIVKALGDAGSDNPKLTYQYMLQLHEEAMKRKIAPFVDEYGREFYSLGYRDQCFHLHKNHLTHVGKIT